MSHISACPVTRKKRRFLHASLGFNSHVKYVHKGTTQKHFTASVWISLSWFL